MEWFTGKVQRGGIVMHASRIETTHADRRGPLANDVFNRKRCGARGPRSAPSVRPRPR